MKSNFDLLKEYFDNTPKEIILKEWEATKEFDKVESYHAWLRLLDHPVLGHTAPVPPEEGYRPFSA